VIEGGKGLRNKVILGKSLSKDVTSEQLMNNLSVVIQAPSRRRLEEVFEVAQ